MQGPNLCDRSKPLSMDSSSSVTVTTAVLPAAAATSAAGEEEEDVAAGEASGVAGTTSRAAVASGVLGVFSSSMRSLARDDGKSEVMVPGVPPCLCGRLAAESGTASAPPLRL